VNDAPFPLYPTRPMTAEDRQPPCPDCGRYGGHPTYPHGGQSMDGADLDLSLAGLRCTAEALVGMVEALGTALYGAGDETDAHYMAVSLYERIAHLDYLAGGVDVDS
jgi:hypothetical protein